MSTAPRSKRTTGPTTTPDIQVLLFDDEIDVIGCAVGCGVLEVVARFEDVDLEEVAPMYALSTKMLDEIDCEHTTGWYHDRARGFDKPTYLEARRGYLLCE